MTSSVKFELQRNIKEDDKKLGKSKMIITYFYKNFSKDLKKL